MSPLFWEATRPPTTAISAAIAPPITTTSGCADDGDDGEAARSASGTLVGKAPGGRAMSGAGITNARAMPGRKRYSERYLARAQPGRGPASPSAPRPLRLPRVESQRQEAAPGPHPRASSRPGGAQAPGYAWAQSRAVQVRLPAVQRRWRPQRRPAPLRSSSIAFFP